MRSTLQMMIVMRIWYDSPLRRRGAARQTLHTNEFPTHTDGETS
jgi:hypothetical protein